MEGIFPIHVLTEILAGSILRLTAIRLFLQTLRQWTIHAAHSQVQFQEKGTSTPPDLSLESMPDGWSTTFWREALPWARWWLQLHKASQLKRQTLFRSYPGISSPQVSGFQAGKLKAVCRGS